ncbi:MAG: hypothetical protein E6K70_10460 [Planctomycetota bacterium]|nr:MAG: hypothetical protein E6K70_10460 [Planctomycetota bacterium]
MSSTTAANLPLSPVVRDFLRKQDAEETLEKVCELVRDSYPDLRAMRFFLRDDPDTEGRQWLVIEIDVPRTLACTSELRDRERAFHARFVTEIPLAQCSLFSLGLHFTSN